LLHDPQQNAAVVDPAEAEPVLERLAELKADLVAILTPIIISIILVVTQNYCNL